MKKDIKSFASLYGYIKDLPENDTFLNHRESESWKTYSKKEFIETVRYLSLAFDAEGWRGRQIALAIPSSAYWLLIDYALMLSGAVSVPLFTNISSKNLRFQIQDADLHTVFTQTEEQEKIILDADSSITCINIDSSDPTRQSLEALIQTGKEIDQQSPDRFEKLISGISSDDLVTIVYTSGTSGLPKGVELTHFNLISQILDTSENYKLYPDKDTALSLLPLAHIFERMVMHYYLSTGISVYFADDVRNIGNLLNSVHPTVMTVVPRLLEKVCFKMHTKAMAGSLVKKIIAMIAFYRTNHKDPENSNNWLDNLLDKLVYSKFRNSLGGNLRMMISGGAPLADDIYRFFLNIGIPLYQGYGLTEASPVICANAPGKNKVGTCGRRFSHTETKIDKDGELFARGPGIMRGYHNNPEATREVIDHDGWLRTGDLATMDDEKYITITGRSKELSKTSTGEYISIHYIEHFLMMSGWFDHVLIIGNNRPFVVVLLMVDSGVALEFAQKYGLKDKEDVVESRQFQKQVWRIISKINRKLNHWEKIRDFYLIPEPLTVENGDLTPSMKLARDHVQKRFKEIIERMYKDHI
ncbi:MAG TPA: long-chain fatty acid--CoA ligase [Desulfocapsa sulfexigens]|nr:long-chain fatty acid--CoA ligase [Desulfocapsa sulfexigens]